MNGSTALVKTSTINSINSLAHSFASEAQNKASLIASNVSSSGKKALRSAASIMGAIKKEEIKLDELQTYYIKLEFIYKCLFKNYMIKMEVADTSANRTAFETFVKTDGIDELNKGDKCHESAVGLKKSDKYLYNELFKNEEIKNLVERPKYIEKIKMSVINGSKKLKDITNAEQLKNFLNNVKITSNFIELYYIIKQLYFDTEYPEDLDDAELKNLITMLNNNNFNAKLVNRLLKFKGKKQTELELQIRDKLADKNFNRQVLEFYKKKYNNEQSFIEDVNGHTVSVGILSKATDTHANKEEQQNAIIFLKCVYKGEQFPQDEKVPETVLADDDIVEEEPLLNIEPDSSTGTVSTSPQNTPPSRPQPSRPPPPQNTPPPRPPPPKNRKTQSNQEVVVQQNTSSIETGAANSVNDLRKKFEVKSGGSSNNSHSLTRQSSSRKLNTESDDEELKNFADFMDPNKSSASSVIVNRRSAPAPPKKSSTYGHKKRSNKKKCNKQSNHKKSHKKIRRRSRK